MGAQVISFNLGSLGFLTNHEFHTFREDLRDVIHGGYGLGACSLPDEEIKARPPASAALMASRHEYQSASCRKLTDVVGDCHVWQYRTAV